ncbi:MAG: hypothetical protein ACFFG0_06295 [Candidatus Thorarchaeota archaeon]
MANEGIRHIEAFEYYYVLGDKRTLRAVGKKFKVSEQSVSKWSASFNWHKRVEQRDIEIATKLERKTNRTILNTKADYRKEIKNNLLIVKALLSSAIKEIKAESIKANNVYDVNNLLTAFEKLVNLDLKLIGEAEQLDVNIDDVINALPESIREGVRRSLIERISRKEIKK